MLRQIVQTKRTEDKSICTGKRGMQLTSIVGCELLLRLSSFDVPVSVRPHLQSFVGVFLALCVFSITGNPAQTVPSCEKTQVSLPFILID